MLSTRVHVSTHVTSASRPSPRPSAAMRQKSAATRVPVCHLHPGSHHKCATHAAISCRPVQDRAFTPRAVGVSPRWHQPRASSSPSVTATRPRPHCHPRSIGGADSLVPSSVLSSSSAAVCCYSFVDQGTRPRRCCSSHCRRRHHQVRTGDLLAAPRPACFVARARLAAKASERAASIVIVSHLVDLAVGAGAVSTPTTSHAINILIRGW